MYGLLFSIVIMDKPPESMWKLIERKKVPPTRKMRYCCTMTTSGGSGAVGGNGGMQDKKSHFAANMYYNLTFTDRG